MSSVKRVLMVEDNPGHARLIQASLEGFVGLTIEWVRDGEAALRRLNDSSQPLPDLVLLDLKLPRIGGHEVLRQLKQTERLRRIPTVVLSTSHQETDVAGAYDAHASAYLVKPTDFSHLQALLHDTVSFWCARNRMPSGQSTG
jgi:CheY-like chemotaxis protein